MSATPLAIATQQDNLFPMQRDIDELVCAGGAIGCRQQGSHSIAQQRGNLASRVFPFGAPGQLCR
jgi:hypothetical protein